MFTIACDINMLASPIKNTFFTLDSPFEFYRHWLEKEGLLLGHPDDDVKLANFSHWEEVALSSTNQAVRCAFELPQSQNVKDAAKLLEQIQVLSAEAERAAYIHHGPIAMKACHIAKKLTIQARLVFKSLKEKLEA